MPEFISVLWNNNTVISSRMVSISNFRSIVLGLIFASIGILENLLKILLNPINYIRCSLQCLSRLKEISKYQLLNLISRVVLKLFKTIPIPEPCKNNKEISFMTYIKTAQVNWILLKIGMCSKASNSIVFGSSRTPCYSKTVLILSVV